MVILGNQEWRASRIGDGFDGFSNFQGDAIAVLRTVLVDCVGRAFRNSWLNRAFAVRSGHRVAGGSGFLGSARLSRRTVIRVTALR